MGWTVCFWKPKLSLFPVAPLRTGSCRVLDKLSRSMASRWAGFLRRQALKRRFTQSRFPGGSVGKNTCERVEGSRPCRGRSWAGRPQLMPQAPWSCNGPWAPLGAGTGCSGGGGTLHEAAAFEEETVSKQPGWEHLCPRGWWRACSAVGPLPPSCRDAC